MSKVTAVWADICRFAGSPFVTKTGIVFTYTVDGNYVIPSRTKWKIPESDFNSAYRLVPFAGPGVINKSHQGPAYIWAILHDYRIGRRYAPLYAFLNSAPQTATEYWLSFEQIEQLLGRRLPPAARKHTAWWANDETHVQAVAWLRAGFKASTAGRAIANGKIQLERRHTA